MDINLVNFTADTTKIDQAINKIGSKINTLGGKQSDIKVDVDTTQALKGIDKIDKELKSIKSPKITPEVDSSQIDKASGGIKGKLSDMFSGLGGTLATGGIAAAGVAVGMAVKSIVSSGIDFQATLADMSAITGVTGAALKNFGDMAKDLSNKFGGSALDQITAFKGILSKLGPDIAKSPEALKSMADSVNILSKASGMDATASMEALTTGLLQFNISMDDPIEAAKEMAKQMNVMAAGAEQGASEIPMVKEAIEAAGVAASSANLSFEETNAAIQVFAAGGKQGAEAGTSLRNILLMIQAPSSEAEKALKGLGTSSQDLGKILTTQGLSPAIDMLKSKMVGLSDQAQNVALAEIFGKDNVTGAGILLERSKMLGDLTTKLTGTDTAVRQAAINMDTFKAKIDRTMSQLSNVGLGIFDAFVAIANPIMDYFSNIWELAKSLWTGILDTLWKGIKPVWDTVVELYNEFAKLFKSAGDGKGIMDSLKSAFEFVGRIIGAYLVPMIRMLLLPFQLLVKTITWVIGGINELAESFKKTGSTGDGFIDFMIKLTGWIIDAVKWTAKLTEGFLEFIGLKDKEENKAPVNSKFKGYDTAVKKGQAVEVPGVDIVPDKKKTESVKKETEKEYAKFLDGLDKLLADNAIKVEKIEEDQAKASQERLILNLEAQKKAILENVLLTGAQKGRLAYQIEQNINKEKANLDKLALDQKFQSDINAAEKSMREAVKLYPEGSQARIDAQNSTNAYIKILEIQYNQDLLAVDKKYYNDRGFFDAEAHKKTLETKKVQEEEHSVWLQGLMGFTQSFIANIKPQKIDNKDIEDRKKKLQEAENDLKNALKAGKISYEDYTSGMADLATQEAENVKTNMISIGEAVRLAFEDMSKSAEANISKTFEAFQKSVAGSEEETRAKSQLIGEAVMVAGSVIADTLSDSTLTGGQKALKILAELASKMLAMYAPLIISAFASWLGPYGAIAGAVVVAGAAAALAAASASIGAEEGGLIDRQYKKKPGRTDTIHAMLAPNEFVVNAQDTQKNLPLLKHLNEGGSIEGYLATNGFNGILNDISVSQHRYDNGLSSKLDIVANEIAYTNEILTRTRLIESKTIINDNRVTTNRQISSKVRLYR